MRVSRAVAAYCAVHTKGPKLGLPLDTKRLGPVQQQLRPSGGVGAALRRTLWRLDPGLIQSSKAVLVLAALGSTLGLSYLLLDLWPGLERLDLSLFMGGGAITLVLAMNPEPRRLQRRLLFLGALAFQAALLGLGLIALLTGPDAMVWSKLALLPLAAACLYPYRFGAGAMGLGKGIFAFALFAAMQEPSWAQVPDFMLATGLGSLVFLLLERLLPRPTALSVLPRGTRVYLNEVAERLRALSGSDHGRVPGWAPNWLYRQPLRLLLRTARAEEPQRATLLSRRLLVSYRMELSLRLLSRSLTTADALSDALWTKTVAALDETARRMCAERAGGSQPGLALQGLKQAALALPACDADSRRHLVGAAAAMQRLLILRAALDEDCAPDHYGPPPVPVLANGGLSPAMRLALQGLVGVSIATALDLGFAMQHGYWATITVFFILSGSLGETLVRAQKRFLGTVLGVGLALAYIWLSGPAGDLVLAFLSALSLGLVVASMLRFWGTAAFGLGFMVISALHLVQDLPIESMLARIYETGIGAAIGMLVARLVLPLHLGRGLERDLIAWLADARRLLSHMGHLPAAVLRRESMALGERAGTIGDSLPHLRAEAWLGLRALNRPVAVHTALDAIIGYLALLEPSVTRLPFEHGNQPSDREARALYQHVSRCLAALRAGKDAQVHDTLAQVEETLRDGDRHHFRESDITHLETRLEQIFYLTALIQVIDDLSLALHPH